MGTKQRVIDDVKIDCGMVPTSLAATNLTGPYFNLASTERSCWVCTYGPFGTTATVKLEVFQAKTINAGSAALLAGATQITAATEILHYSANKQITLATFVATSTITVTALYNNAAYYALTYTAHATTTTISSRQFSISGSDTADATELLSCLNDASYGTPGITWIQAAGVVNGYAQDPNITFTITCSVDNGTDTRIVPQGFLVVEVDKSAFTVGYNWAAAKVTTVVGTIVCAVTLIRHMRYSPNVQQSDVVPISLGA
jgi:hypothetical protein